MSQANVSRVKAVRALKNNNNDIVNAIMVSCLHLETPMSVIGAVLEICKLCESMFRCELTELQHISAVSRQICVAKRAQQHFSRGVRLFEISNIFGIVPAIRFYSHRNFTTVEPRYNRHGCNGQMGITDNIHPLGWPAYLSH
uniref:Nascent polypeptide associated complex alpha polypeptide n=1 Tax=Rhipicephalus zambeziensis TaxID=60191 RepID=A0A224YUJ2_9ACAR